MSGGSRRHGIAPGPARHERPVIDEAALIAGQAAARMLAAATARGATRWVTYLEPMPDALNDGALTDLRRVAMRARAAYGPKDSVRDVLPREVTEPFLEAIDRLLKELAKRELGAG